LLILAPDPRHPRRSQAEIPLIGLSEFGRPPLHRKVDLVVPAVQYLISIGQRGLTMETGNRLGGHGFIGIAGQRTATTFATQAAFARSDAFGFLRLVQLLPLRRRQAGIVRCLRWFAEPGFQIGNSPLSPLKAFPQRPDQGILLGVAQLAEIGKLAPEA
jgi:hypothetical protein